jgi:hypothetical protein
MTAPQAAAAKPSRNRLAAKRYCGWMRLIWLAALAGLAAFPVEAQAPGKAGPATLWMPDGKPDLSGIWQVLNRAAWDIQDHTGRLDVPPGRGVVEGNEVPYQPWAAKKKEENAAQRKTADATESDCFLPGVPRATYMPYPFEMGVATLGRRSNGRDEGAAGLLPCGRTSSDRSPRSSRWP